MLWKDIEGKINKMVNRIQTGVFGKISSVIKKDSSVYIKLSEEEEIRDIIILSTSGVHSLPKVGKFGQAIFNNSNKKATLLGVENNDTPVQIDIGEVIIFNGGNYIYLKNSGAIEIKGNITVTGNINATGTVNGSNI